MRNPATIGEKAAFPLQKRDSKTGWGRAISEREERELGFHKGEEGVGSKDREGEMKGEERRDLIERGASRSALKSRSNGSEIFRGSN